MEIWKDIKGYEGLYQVSDLGRVRSLDRIDTAGKKRKGMFLKLSSNNRGYQTVRLYLNGNNKVISVHQLVAMEFLNHVPNGLKLVVDHIDNDQLNNKLSNLQIITHRENTSKDKSGKCKSTGVFLRKNGNFRCGVYLEGKYHWLGTYKSEKEASDIYNKVLKDYNNGIITTHEYQRKKSSKYKYVTWNKKSSRWQVSGWNEGKSVYGGLFDSEEEAYKKAKELFNI